MSKRSEQTNELFSALAKAQAEIKNAMEDKTNPHFKSSYASLASVWDACREPLAKNGLCVAQPTCSENEILYVETILGHSSGQWMESRMPAGNIRDKPHVMGSNLTYSRRYALAAMVGVAPGDDDDANAAQFQEVKNKSKTYTNISETKSIGYDEFVKKHNIYEGTPLHDYIKFVCIKTKKNESDIIALAVQNEEGFFSQYNKWVSSKVVEGKVSEMTG